MAGAPEAWGKFVYRIVNAPNRRAWINSFADESGNAVPMPFAPAWPMGMLVEATLEEAVGGTTPTLRAVAHEATEIERAIFAAGMGPMRQGFGGTLVKLAAYPAVPDQKHRRARSKRRFRDEVVRIRGDLSPDAHLAAIVDHGHIVDILEYREH